ncbi:MAG: TM0106 family RecB-like putative nuclease [Microcystaceae cyanobacterium]
MLNFPSSLLITDTLLLDYKRCQRRAFLDIYGNELEKRSEKDFLTKLRQESRKHVQQVISTYFPHAQPLQNKTEDWQQKALETYTLMEQGVDCIYRGTLQGLHASNLPLIGTPDLLIKGLGQSKFGNWLYYPVSIHFGRRPKPEYKLVATFYTDLLRQIQGISPPQSQLILRRKNRHTVDLTRWYPRLQETLDECVQVLVQQNEPEVFISRQRCSLCHWYDHCYKIAQEDNHLSLVPGVTPNRYESLQTLGVMTVESLANTDPHHLRETMSLEIAQQLQRQAQSILENRPILKAAMPHALDHWLPTAPIEFYFDIEAEPEQKLDYLLGILQVDRQNHQQIFYSFLAETPQQEGQIWQKFVNLMMQYESAPIFHFSEYEAETIKRLAHLYHTPKYQSDRLLSRLTDLHQRVTTIVTLPVESYSLKAIAQWVGFQWREQGVGGDQCVFWYDQWLKTEDRRYLTYILRYNEDDCRATFWVKDWLHQFLNEV